jgi:hypothetical protein
MNNSGYMSYSRVEVAAGTRHSARCPNEIISNRIVEMEMSSPKSYLKRIEFSVQVWEYVHERHDKFHIFYILHRGKFHLTALRVAYKILSKAKENRDGKR